MPSITVNIPQSLNDHFKKRATAKMMSKSALIRQVLAAQVEKEEKKKLKNATQPA